MPMHSRLPAFAWPCSAPLACALQLAARSLPTLVPGCTSVGLDLTSREGAPRIVVWLDTPATAPCPDAIWRTIPPTVQDVPILVRGTDGILQTRPAQALWQAPDRAPDDGPGAGRPDLSPVGRQPVGATERPVRARLG